ncbi:M23 family metallopeptidase [Brevibacillus massiliensis]|jgi:stage IV sporulation protein FA|uniref:M23 family metallopeptidase n=1 Tax=Brevibacillus massiliensis TaxID=1118054 RepID=UPI0003129EAA|nr:M23 family metallopeptidase [Brevibacillus massiliensis]
MFGEVDRVKERRHERMERIRLQMRDSLPPYLHELSDPAEEPFTAGPAEFRSRKEMPPRERFSIQVAVSLLLMGVAFVIFKTSLPLPETWKTAARDVMQRDFNFEGSAAWLQSKLGLSPSVLPALQSSKTAAAPTPAKVALWQMPHEWRLVKPFDPTSVHVVFDLGSESDVINKEPGWVTFIGEKSGMGETVIVQYGRGREVWYGNFAQVHVAVNDWVKQGDLLGAIKTVDESSSYLFVALKERDTFVNPLDVIAVD